MITAEGFDTVRMEHILVGEFVMGVLLLTDGDVLVRCASGRVFRILSDSNIRIQEDRG